MHCRDETSSVKDHLCVGKFDGINEESESARDQRLHECDVVNFQKETSIRKRPLVTPMKVNRTKIEA